MPTSSVHQTLNTVYNASTNALTVTTITGTPSKVVKPANYEPNEVWGNALSGAALRVIVVA